jgi:DNA-binding transcriptional ArsR family regulator
MLERLTHGEASVSELAQPFDVSLPAISKHLRVLERAQLVERRRDGRVRRVSMLPVPIDEAAEWIERQRSFWENRLDSLDEYLQSEPKG